MDPANHLKKLLDLITYVAQRPTGERFPLNVKDVAIECIETNDYAFLKFLVANGYRDTVHDALDCLDLTEWIQEHGLE